MISYLARRVSDVPVLIVLAFRPDVPEAASDLLAFYNEAVDITVDGEPQERPVTLFSSRVNSGR